MKQYWKAIAEDLNKGNIPCSWIERQLILSIAVYKTKWKKKVMPVKIARLDFLQSVASPA